MFLVIGVFDWIGVYLRFVFCFRVLLFCSWGYGVGSFKGENWFVFVLCGFFWFRVFFFLGFLFWSIIKRLRVLFC